MTDLDLQLDNVVLFELPTYEDVEVFATHFRSQWPGWSHDDGTVWLFTAELDGTSDRLAKLLRDVQILLVELGLPSIRFCLDNRAYELKAASPAAATVAA